MDTVWIAVVSNEDGAFALAARSRDGAIQAAASDMEAAYGPGMPPEAQAQITGMIRELTNDNEWTSPGGETTVSLQQSELAD